MVFDNSQFSGVRGLDCQAEIGAVLEVFALEFGDPFEVEPVAELNIDVLLETARLNKVSLFVLRQSAAFPEIRDLLVERLDPIRLRSWMLNRASIAVATELGALLAENDIRHLQFKGPLQQAALFGDATLKPSGDVDILVSPGDRARADLILRRAGLVSMGGEMSAWWSAFLGEQHYRRPTGGAVVDLHHRLQQPGSPSPQHPSRMLARACEQSFEGRSYNVPSPSDTSLIVAMNVVKALFGHEPCGGYVLDLRAALDRLSPAERNELQSEAHLQGLAETLELGCHAVDALFPGAPNRYSVVETPLRGTDVDQLRDMILAPWKADLSWPRRRSVLWALCGRSPYRYGREAARVASSELFRRALTRRAEKRQKSKELRS